jgi:O-antigen ligase
MTIPPRQAPAKTGGTLAWVLLFALIPGGLSISVGGRAPDVLLVDLCIVAITTFLVLRAILGSFHFDLSDTRLLLLASLYLLANLLSVIFNLQDVLRSILAIKVFAFGYLTYLLLVSTTRSRFAILRALYGMALWAGIVSVLLVYHFLTQWQTELDKNEIGLSMGKSNYLAAMLVPIVPLVVALLVVEKGLWRRTLLSAVCVLVVLGLLITMSRGALASLLIASVLAIPLFRKAGLRWKHIAYSLMAMGVLGLTIPSELLSSNYALILARFQTPDVARVDLWTIAWQTFLQNPLLGVGPNCMYLYNYQFAFPDLHTHNFVLNNLAEVGLLGSIPFFAMIGIIVTRAYRLCLASTANHRASVLALGALVGLIATLTHGLVEPTFPGSQYSVVFWTCVAIVSVLQQQLAQGPLVPAPSSDLNSQPLQYL